MNSLIPVDPQAASNCHPNDAFSESSSKGLSRNNPISLTICGERYYFCGYDKDYHSEKYGNGEGMDVYVVYGSNDTWYRHYHVSGDCCSEWSSRLHDTYPGLAKLLENQVDPSCPTQMTLGTESYCYILTRNQYFRNLPPSIKNDINASDLRNIRKLWLGASETYVAEFYGGILRWELKGHYPGLESTLQNGIGDPPCKTIKALALDTSSHNAFAIILTSGAGYIRTHDRSMKETFNKFREANLGTIEHPVVRSKIDGSDEKW